MYRRSFDRRDIISANQLCEKLTKVKVNFFSKWSKIVLIEHNTKESSSYTVAFRDFPLVRKRPWRFILLNAF